MGSMTPQQEIEAALARLELQPPLTYVSNRRPLGWHTLEDRLSPLDKPLAALIRDISHADSNEFGFFRHCCGESGFYLDKLGHAPDCSLLALVRAINGGETP